MPQMCSTNVRPSNPVSRLRRPLFPYSPVCSGPPQGLRTCRALHPGLPPHPVFARPSSSSLPPALAEKPARLSTVSPEPRCGAGAQVCTLTETGSHPHERSVGLHQALPRGPCWPALHFPDPRRPRTHKNQPQAPNAPLPPYSWGSVAWAAARTWAGTEVGGPGPSASFGPQFLWKPQQAG